MLRNAWVARAPGLLLNDCHPYQTYTLNKTRMNKQFLPVRASLSTSHLNWTDLTQKGENATIDDFLGPDARSEGAASSSAIMVESSDEKSQKFCKQRICSWYLSRLQILILLLFCLTG